MNNINKVLRNTLLGITAFTLPVVASAQLEEIIVTAQKRAESLNDVPIAVTAFTAETMKSLGVTNASDLVALTPGLHSNNQAGSNRNYFLRGVGTADFHLTASPAIGQYFDGVTLTSGFQAKAALFDMDRVEILKGPQNILFGLNTTGGAVNYISKKPEIGAGTNGTARLVLGSDSHVGIDAAVGFDLGESSAGRVALHSNKYDGFDSVASDKDFGAEDIQAFRAAFLWEPNDRSSLALNIHGMTNENNGAAVKAVGTRAPDGSGNRCAEFSGLTAPDFERNTSCVGRNGGATGELPADPSTGDWDTVSQSFGFEDVDTKGFYLKYDYDFDWAELNLTYAFDNLDFQSSSDTEGNSTTGAHLNQADDRDTSQFEARLISPADRAFRWIGGVFYLDEKAESFTGILSPGIGGSVGIPNVYLEHTKENLSVYGQIEFDIMESLTFTAGARWSDEEIVGNYRPSFPRTVGTQIGISTPVTPELVDQLVRAQADPTNPNQDANGYDVRRQVQQTIPNKDTGFTAKLDWKINDDSLVYASYSKGFKGGALDIRAAYALVPANGLLSGNLSVTPESLDAYEIGYKASFLENSINFDAAAYWYTYNDLALFVVAGGTPQLANAPESEISGFDANLKYANDSGFYLDVGLSVIDTELTDAGTAPFVVGTELGNAPDFSISATASQDFELSNGNAVTVALNVNRIGEAHAGTPTGGNINIVDARTQSAYTIVNANATYRFGSDQQYSFSAFANNLTDEHFCYGQGSNEGNRILADGLFPRALSYTFTCGVTRATKRTLGASFSMDF